jgi:hypothetical protein
MKAADEDDAWRDQGRQQFEAAYAPEDAVYEKLLDKSSGVRDRRQMLRYIELKSGYSDNGPAWIGYATPSKTGRTIYFNGRALRKLKGQERTGDGGNYCDMETGESFWVSGVKKNGRDRHWAGAGKIQVEAGAVSEYLEAIGSRALDKSLYEVTHSIVPTDIKRYEMLANTSYREAVPGDHGPERPIVDKQKRGGGV